MGYGAFRPPNTRALTFILACSRSIVSVVDIESHRMYTYCDRLLGFVLVKLICARPNPGLAHPA